MEKNSSFACELCVNYSYDAQYDEYVCSIDMDEDEALRLLTYKRYNCPYYRPGDEYTIVKKQM